MPGLGESFRAAREARNLSLSDVAEQIHIRAVYLQAIEEEDWSTIAAPVYVRGFLRTYARFLGLDPQGSIDQFNAVAGEPSSAPPPVSVSQTRRTPSPWLWIGGLAAALLVGLVAYNFIQLQRAPQGDLAAIASPSVSASATATPSPALKMPLKSPGPVKAGLPIAASVSASAGASGSVLPSASASPSESGPPKVGASPNLSAPLVVRVTAPSWLRIDVDGQNKEEGVFQKGAVLTFGGAAAKVRAGNAGGVDITLNGKEQGPLGKSGDVVERSYALKAEPGG